MKKLLSLLSFVLCCHLANAQYPVFKTYETTGLGNLVLRVYGNVNPNPVCSPLNFTNRYNVPGSSSLAVFASVSSIWLVSPAATQINAIQYGQDLSGTVTWGPVLSICGLAPGIYTYTIPAAGGAINLNLNCAIEVAPSCFKIIAF